MSDRYAMPRIGQARGHVHPETGGQSLYSVHEVTAKTVTVTYAGYVTADGVMVGLPLGGPSWSPPIPAVMPRSAFSVIRIFSEEVN